MIFLKVDCVLSYFCHFIILSIFYSWSSLWKLMRNWFYVPGEIYFHLIAFFFLLSFFFMHNLDQHCIASHVHERASCPYFEQFEQSGTREIWRQRHLKGTKAFSPSNSFGNPLVCCDDLRLHCRSYAWHVNYFHVDCCIIGLDFF